MKVKHTSTKTIKQIRDIDSSSDFASLTNMSEAQLQAIIDGIESDGIITTDELWLVVKVLAKSTLRLNTRIKELESNVSV